eukprot:jgi/Chlat1/8697/Chrsp88S00668
MQAAGAVYSAAASCSAKVQRLSHASTSTSPPRCRSGLFPPPSHKASRVVRCALSTDHMAATDATAVAQRKAQNAGLSKRLAESTRVNDEVAGAIGYDGLHHTGIICENLEKSLEFYCGVLGMSINTARPDDRLYYRGVWLWVGKGTMIHLMELTNPDSTTGRPEHGGEDRHSCIAVNQLDAMADSLTARGCKYTMSKSGRKALFTRDPDGNALEFFELQG